MKKVGICACYNTFNYGSMLQSFATQKTIENLGYECEFIVYQKKKSIKYIIKQFPRLFNKYLIYEKMLSFKKRIRLKNYKEFEKLDDVRKKAFLRFQEKYYNHFSPVYYGYDNLCEAAYTYSAIIVGSDQLWSPAGLGTNFYNLMFVPDDIKKISYATSFGVSSIPRYQLSRTRAYLRRINYLSVREAQGAKIVKELIGTEAKVVADPTLLLSTKQWDKEIPNERLIGEPYILCYFLGENSEHREIAIQLKHEMGIKIVSMPFLDTFVKEDVNFGDIQMFNAGPDGFINLIRNAECVLTDSFHGSIFSILYHKQFMTLNRYCDGSNSRNSRLDSLFGYLGLEDRRYCAKCGIREQMENCIDYRTVDQRISELRSKSIKFLNDALAN